MCSFITKEILFKLEPIKKKISSIYEGKETEKEKELLKGLTKFEEKEKNNNNQEINNNNLIENLTKPYFSIINLNRKPNNISTPNEITKFNLDKSELLNQLLLNYPNDKNGILGEFQFSFICFLMGESFDAFDHWKELIKIFCQCDIAMKENPNLFLNFIDIFLNQLKHIPEDFFQDALSENNFLLHCLKQFFELLNDNQILDKLKNKTELLLNYIRKRFGKKFFNDSIDYYDENDEDAPIIVQME